MDADVDFQNLLGTIIEPATQLPLSQLKMVKSVSIDGDQVSVHIELPTPAYAWTNLLTGLIETAAKTNLKGNKTAQVQYSSTVKGKQAGGNIGLKIKNIIAVGSGKGGVGKSTVSAALAYGLKEWGATVGLMDADVYGPSIPHLTGATGQPAIRQYPTGDGRVFERIEPIEANGIKTISMGFMIDPDQAVIWRGPMLHKALGQFLQQTDWGELDYLVIDMPPGTGDVALTLSQMVPLAGAVVVCTPQQVALLDAGKAISMYNTVKIPILGMVENMTGEIFGRGGAKAKAESAGIEFLGEIPSDAIIRIKGDEGKIAELFAEESPVREPLMTLASTVAMQVAKKFFESPAMPTLELL